MSKAMVEGTQLGLQLASDVGRGKEDHLSSVWTLLPAAQSRGQTQHPLSLPSAPSFLGLTWDG